MPPRARVVLALVGLLIIVISLAALAYAWTPVQTNAEQIPLAPTLLVPPGGLP